MQAFNINKAEAQKILQIKSETESKSLHSRIQNMFIFILGELRQWFQSKINLLTPAVSSTLLQKHHHSQELCRSFISTYKNEQYRPPQSQFLTI